MSGFVHFKFKSSIHADKVEFPGAFVSVGELKQLIAEKKKLEKDASAELVLTDTKTKAKYEDDAQLIPKNSAVIVSRLPSKLPRAQQQRAGTASAAVSHQQPATGAAATTADEFGVDPYADRPAAPLGADEEAVALQRLLEGHADKWEKDVQAAGRGRGRGGRFAGRGRFGGPPGAPGRPGVKEVPPPTYICNRCGKGGHYIQDCPTQEDPEHTKRYHRPRGIPMTRLGHSENGGLILPDGSFGSLVPNEDVFLREMGGVPSMAKPQPSAEQAASGAVEGPAAKPPPPALASGQPGSGAAGSVQAKPGVISTAMVPFREPPAPAASAAPLQLDNKPHVFSTAEPTLAGADELFPDSFDDAAAFEMPKRAPPKPASQPNLAVSLLPTPTAQPGGLPTLPLPFGPMGAAFMDPFAPEPQSVLTREAFEALQELERARLRNLRGGDRRSRSRSRSRSRRRGRSRRSRRSRSPSRARSAERSRRSRSLERSRHRSRSAEASRRERGSRERGRERSRDRDHRPSKHRSHRDKKRSTRGRSESVAGSRHTSPPPAASSMIVPPASHAEVAQAACVQPHAQVPQRAAAGDICSGQLAASPARSQPLPNERDPTYAGRAHVSPQPDASKQQGRADRMERRRAEPAAKPQHDQPMQDAEEPARERAAHDRRREVPDKHFEPSARQQPYTGRRKADVPERYEAARQQPYAGRSTAAVPERYGSARQLPYSGRSAAANEGALRFEPASREPSSKGRRAELAAVVAAAPPVDSRSPSPAQFHDMRDLLKAKQKRKEARWQPETDDRWQEAAEAAAPPVIKLAAPRVPESGASRHKPKGSRWGPDLASGQPPPPRRDVAGAEGDRDSVEEPPSKRSRLSTDLEPAAAATKRAADVQQDSDHGPLPKKLTIPLDGFAATKSTGSKKKKHKKDKDERDADGKKAKKHKEKHSKKRKERESDGAGPAEAGTAEAAAAAGGSQPASAEAGGHKGPAASTANNATGATAVAAAATAAAMADADSQPPASDVQPAARSRDASPKSAAGSEAAVPPPAAAGVSAAVDQPAVQADVPAALALPALAGQPDVAPQHSRRAEPGAEHAELVEQRLGRQASREQPPAPGVSTSRQTTSSHQDVLPAEELPSRGSTPKGSREPSPEAQREAKRERKERTPRKYRHKEASPDAADQPPAHAAASQAPAAEAKAAASSHRASRSGRDRDRDQQDQQRERKAMSPQQKPADCGAEKPLQDGNVVQAELGGRGGDVDRQRSRPLFGAAVAQVLGQEGASQHGSREEAAVVPLEEAVEEGRAGDKERAHKKEKKEKHSKKHKKHKHHHKDKVEA